MNMHYSTPPPSTSYYNTEVQKIPGQTAGRYHLSLTTGPATRATTIVASRKTVPKKCSPKSASDPRPADQFQDLISIARYDASSPGGASLTIPEIHNALAVLGTPPALTRIAEVQRLYLELAATGIDEAPKVYLRDWLTQNELPPANPMLSQKIAPLLSNLLWPSETDRPIVITTLGTFKERLDADAIRKLLKEPCSTSIESLSVFALFRPVMAVRTSSDTLGVQQALQFRKLYRILRTSLTDITAFKVGTIDRDIVIAGRAANGEVVVLLTSVVET